MRVLLEVTVDRLGVPPDTAVKLLCDHIPEYLTGGGYTIEVTGATVKGVTHERQLCQLGAGPCSHPQCAGPAPLTPAIRST